MQDHQQKYLSLCDDFLRYKSLPDYINAVAEDLDWIKKTSAKEIPVTGFAKLLRRKSKPYLYEPKLYLYHLLDAVELHWEYARSNKHGAPYTLIFMSYYLACKNNDMGLFQRGLYQYSRRNAVKFGMLGNSGTDHCLNTYKAIYGLAAADAELFSKLLPERLGRSNNGNPFDCMMTNIAMGLWYRNRTLLTEGLETARKRQTLKNETKLCKILGRYMLALADKDAESASVALNEFCQNAAYDKEGTFHISVDGAPYMDLISPFAHGLYNLAFYVLDKDTFSQIRRPISRFDTDYADWLIAENFPAPCSLMDFQNEMSVVNILFELIPEASVSRPYKDENRFYIDGEAFREKLMAALAGKIDLEQHFKRYNAVSYREVSS